MTLPAAKRTTRIRFAPGEQIAQAGEPAPQLLVIVRGWAASCRMLDDGRRHITAFHLPGDLCDPAWIRGAASEDLVALGEVAAELLDRERILAASRRLEKVEKLLWRTETVLRERGARWSATLARRSALERVGQLVCDIYQRQSRRGAVEPAGAGGTCEFLARAEDVADFTGLAVDHARRQFDRLKLLGLATLRRGRMTVTDLARLAAVAHFDLAGEGAAGTGLALCDWTSPEPQALLGTLGLS